MAKTTITLIPGDGIGPEVAEATVWVLEAAGAELDWERHLIGKEAVEKFGTPLPPEVLDSIRRTKVALLVISEIYDRGRGAVPNPGL